MRLLAGHDETVIEWASRENGGLGRKPDIALGVINRNGVLKGALLLHKYNPWTWELEVHGIVSNDVAKDFFDGVFNKAGVHRVEIRASIENMGTRKAAPKWGFVLDGRLRDYYGPYGDAYQWHMTKDACRWIKADGIETENASAA